MDNYQCEKTYNNDEIKKTNDSLLDRLEKSNLAIDSEYELSDDKISYLASNMNNDIKVPDLWDRIEKEIIEINSENEFNLIKPIDTKKEAARKKMFLIISKIAAVFLITTALILYTFTRFTNEVNWTSNNLLSSFSLKKVESIEKQYIVAINQLESTVNKKIDKMDEQLSKLYKNKIHTIDEQIAKCQEAIKTNPANSHIRKYLYAALKDKKETLKEILEYKI